MDQERTSRKRKRHTKRWSVATGRWSKRQEHPSPAGTPPRSRAPGHPLRRIFSVPEALGTRVVVGPVGFGAKIGRKTVPELHEHGGAALRRVFVEKPPRNRGGGRDRRGKFLKRSRGRMVPVRKIVVYPARPTMGPALAKARPQLPPLWRNSLTRAA